MNQKKNKSLVSEVGIFGSRNVLSLERFLPQEGFILKGVACERNRAFVS